MSDIKIKNIKPRIQYKSDGNTSIYTFSFAIFKPENLEIYFDDIKQTSGYIVSINDNGGFITFEKPPLKDIIITIYRKINIERTSDFQVGGAIRAEELNYELDYQMACVQEVADNLSRSMILPPYIPEVNIDFTLPLPDAGKCIVWSQDGKSITNSKININSVCDELESKKQIAIEQANIAKSKALQSEEYMKICKEIQKTITPFDKVSYISNCITNISQDVKFELNDGILILKAGSKIYIPNGFENNGITPKFDKIVIEKDISISESFETTGQFFIATNASGTSLVKSSINCTTSGTNEPTDKNATWWYDTSSNIIKRYFQGIIQNDTYSFPIAIVSIHCNDNSTIISIDQIFNGFGYIGSTVFVLPDVKGLIPNGRNEDGSLKNIEINLSSVKIGSCILNASSIPVWLKENGEIVFSSDIFYDEKTNIIVNTNEKLLQFATINMDSGVLSNFIPKNAFNAIDRNDRSWLSSLVLPSNRYIELTLGESGSQYIAPANGWMYLSKLTEGENQYATLNNNTKGYTSGNGVYGKGSAIYCFLPVQKGDIVIANYTASGTTSIFKFYYAEGEN